MNFRQMQDYVLQAGQIPLEDSRARQVARQSVNNAMQELLATQKTWSFLRLTAEILTEANKQIYALPQNFGNLLASPSLNGNPLEVFEAEALERYTYNADEADTQSSLNRSSMTITRLTQAPFANTGFVFPTFGSKNVRGINTAFDTRVVGRFFKSMRDGELYEIDSIVSATELKLKQEYTGSSQAGRVQVGQQDQTGSWVDLDLVFGSPNLTNFREGMIGYTIYLQDGTNSGSYIERKIIDVDEYQQILTLETNADNEGTALFYSIQDAYEIDPLQYVIFLQPIPEEDDLVISIPYEAVQTPLTGDNDTPLIPFQHHQAITAGAIAEYYSIESSQIVDLNFWSAKAAKGAAHMWLKDNKYGSAHQKAIRPDVVRTRRTTIAR